MNPKAIQWQAFEYEHVHRTNDWYWAVGIITVSVAVTAIILDNTIFAILVTLIAMLLCIFAKRMPRVITYEVNPKGIVNEKMLYPYSSIESFWVEDRPGHSHTPRILLKSKKNFMPYIILPLGDAPSEEIRNYLTKYLPEEEHHESIAQILLEYIGF